MPLDERRVGAVVLAAGASSRLGRPKQLLVWHGRSLLRRAAATAMEAGCDPIVVVLGDASETMLAELDDLPVTPMIHSGWAEGMASSLRAGVATLQDSPIDALVILLCDQPLVTPDTLRALVAAVGGDVAAAVSIYPNGTQGPPCLFARPLFCDLMALRGDEGARSILRRLPDGAVARVLFSGGGSDIDTEVDWERLSSTLERG